MATATAPVTPDRGRICKLRRTLWQCQILNPLSEARGGTCILRVISRIHFCCATAGTSGSHFLKVIWLLCGSGRGGAGGDRPKSKESGEEAGVRVEQDSGLDQGRSQAGGRNWRGYVI